MVAVFVIVVLLSNSFMQTVRADDDQQQQNPIPQNLVCIKNNKEQDLSKVTSAKLVENIIHFVPLANVTEKIVKKFHALTPCAKSQPFKINVADYDPEVLPAEVQNITVQFEGREEKVSSCKELIKATLETSCQFADDENVTCKIHDDSKEYKNTKKMRCTSEFSIFCDPKDITPHRPGVSYFTSNIWTDQDYNNFPCIYEIKTYPGFHLLVDETATENQLTTISVEECMEDMSECPPLPNPSTPSDPTELADEPKPLTAVACLGSWLFIMLLVLLVLLLIVLVVLIIWAVRKRRQQEQLDDPPPPPFLSQKKSRANSHIKKPSKEELEKRKPIEPVSISAEEVTDMREGPIKGVEVPDTIEPTAGGETSTEDKENIYQELLQPKFFPSAEEIVTPSEYQSKNDEMMKRKKNKKNDDEKKDDYFD